MIARCDIAIFELLPKNVALDSTGQRNTSASLHAGEINPSVLRGPALSSNATRFISFCVNSDR